MSENIKKKIILTGSNSMLGRAIYGNLYRKYDIVRMNHETCDLLNMNEVEEWFYSDKFDFAIHCGGFNGNIEFNGKYPAEIYNKTATMALNVLNGCVKTGIPKVVSMISSCSYPDTGEELLKEENFWMGEPNKTIDGHGFAKRILMEYGRQINKQYGTIHVGLVVNTVYGPYDSYEVHKTKVVGGLIKKFIEAKKKNEDVVCWGSGRPRREFIYCEDVGKCVDLVIEDYNDSDYPINMGSGIDYTISELVDIIAEETQFPNRVIWQTDKPDGQMKKLLDNSKMKKYFGDIDFISLREGIRKTINWYENFHHNTHN